MTAAHPSDRNHGLPVPWQRTRSSTAGLRLRTKGACGLLTTNHSLAAGHAYLTSQTRSFSASVHQPPSLTGPVAHPAQQSLPG